MGDRVSLVRSMEWRNAIHEGLRPIIDLVYPPRCPLCGDALADQGGLCMECWGELEFPGEPSCKSCQRPLGTVAAGRSATCFACEADPPIHSGVIAASLYNDASRQLILNFKHGGKISLAPILAQMIALRLPDTDGQPQLLVPVPLHRWRLWQRGFNQAAMLAKEITRNGHSKAHSELMVDALVRGKRTPSLGGLGREEREKALAGAIAVNPRHKPSITGRNVILVDDVFTSGATSSACTKVLIEAGAASVRIACFARVVDSRDVSTPFSLIQFCLSPEKQNARSHYSSGRRVTK